MSQIVPQVRVESKQFAINIFTNVAVMVMNILIGIWYTPYLIKHLGVATYGIVILATSLTSYMFLFNSAIDNAIGRFLTIDIKRKRFDLANSTFNTAFWTAVGIILLILPLVGLISFYAPQIFDIPTRDERSARWLFMGVMSAYLLVVFRSVFTASPFAHNRLDLKNIITVSNNLTRLLFVVLFFSFLATPDVWQIGIATLIAATVSLILAIIYWRRLTPELRIQKNAFEWKKIKSIFSMSGWLIVNQIGSLLFLNIDLIIINTYLGAEIQGRYASVLQWAVLLRTLAAAVSTAITPLALDQHVRKDKPQLLVMAQNSVKWLGLTLALPVGIISGFAVPLLSTWLGAEFEDLAFLVVILTGHLCFNLSVRPLFSVQVALNRVKWPGIVSVLLGVLNVILAILWVNWGIYGAGVAIASALVLSLRNAVFVPIYGARIQDLPWYTFYKSMIPGILGALISGFLSFALARNFSLESWIPLMMGAGIVAVLYVVFVFLFFVKEDERMFIKRFLYRDRF